MNLSSKAIVLTTIKYNDYDAIIKTYTEQTGFTSFFVKNFYKKRKNGLSKALFQPNALLTLQMSFKNKGHLERIKEAIPIYHYKNIHQDFDKLNIAVFLGEVLLESLQNEQADTQLFHFIQTNFQKLDTAALNPNFHLFFLLELSKFLGFFPDYTSSGSYFDIQNGFFTDKIPLGTHFTIEESLLLKKLLGMIFASKKEIKITPSERKKLIDMLLFYYQHHIVHFKTPKSIKILHQMYE